MPQGDNACMEHKSELVLKRKGIYLEVSTPYHPNELLLAV